MSTPTNPISRLDRPLADLDRELWKAELLKRVAWLVAHPREAEQEHQAFDGARDEQFAALAATHPEACTRSADPVWEAWLAVQIAKSNATRKSTSGRAS